MSFNPEDSAIKVDAALEEQLKGASFEQIKEHLKSAAVDQQLVVRDIFSPDVLLPTPLADAAPQKVGKVVRLNGVVHSLVADDESGLLVQETALYREALKQPAATTQQTEQLRNERGQFVSAEDAAARAELELQFKRGDISASEYLQRSGAVAEYLEHAGVPVETLKEAVAEKQNQKFEQSWANATEEFKVRHPEWVGGDANRNVIGNIIMENNLGDAGDKLAALEAAYDHARGNNLLVENPAVTTAAAVASAQSVEEIRAALGGRSSSMFGR